MLAGGSPAKPYGRAFDQGVANVLRMLLNAHGDWAMPEQSFAPPTPGQLPLSRWIAHIERADMPCETAKSRRSWVWARVVTSVFFG
jgi:hypothetical protein